MVPQGLNILIISLDAYSLLNKQTNYIFGGAELRVVQIAKGLTQRHHARITLFTLDHGFAEERIDDILLLPHPRRKGEGYWAKQRTLGRRIANRIFKTPPATDVPSAYRACQPHVVLIIGMSPEALEAARFCQAFQIPFVFGLASDNDLGGINFTEEFIQHWCSLSLPELREVINTADLLLAQTPEQQTLVHHRFGLKSTLLLNPIDLEKHNAPPALNESFDAIWIGKTSDVKRPELVVEIARLLPQYKFLLVLNRTETVRYEHLLRQASDNVTILEHVKPEQMEATMRLSKLLINTSSAEGFANTYLQAAKNGIPILSAESNPNEMLTRHGCGMLAGSYAATFAQHIDALLKNKNRYQLMVESGPRYVSEYHDANRITDQLYREVTAIYRSRA